MVPIACEAVHRIVMHGKVFLSHCQAIRFGWVFDVLFRVSPLDLFHLMERLLELVFDCAVRRQS